MPSTYDPLLRLELQGVGENATTWGVKTNTNLSLLADSIAGAVPLNVAGTGDYTLSTASGASDESRYSILVLTGLLTGNRNVIVPSSPKNYVVINQTTGAFTVTLKQSAGTGVVITRDGPNLVVCTSTTALDSIGATTFTKPLIASTSSATARGILSAAALAANVFTDEQNLADNLLTRPYIKDYAEVATSPTISGGTLALNLENGNVFTVSLNAAITTLTISNPPATGRAGSFTLILTADGTARAVTWPAAVKWPGGTAPTLTSTNGKRDVLTFLTTDGGTAWLGSVAGQAY
jgi:hypothetical protein